MHILELGGKHSGLVAPMICIIEGNDIASEANKHPDNIFGLFDETAPWPDCLWCLEIWHVSTYGQRGYIPTKHQWICKEA